MPIAHRRPTQTALVGVLVVAVLVSLRLIDPQFMSLEAQAGLAAQSVEMALLAVPMTLILLTGGIDLSVGSTMALSTVVLGLAFESGWSIWIAAALAVVTGAACGAVNGIFVARFRVHPLIVTLATLSLYRGIAEGVSAARPISGFPAQFLSFSTATVAGVPVPTAIFALAVLSAWVMLGFSPTGRFIRAIGFNETAAKFSGVPVGRLKFTLYLLSGTISGLAAVLFCARRNTAKADVGTSIELDVITAVVLGGTSIHGGRGGLVGTLLGVALLHEVRLFVSWRWNHDELVLIVTGALLIGSVLLGRLLATREE